MYVTAYIFFMALIVLGAIRLWQAVKAWDAYKDNHVKMSFDNPQVDIRIQVNCPYTTYKGSGGVLEAYRAGLAFRVAESVYDASEGTLAMLRGTPMPLFVQQTILEELHDR